MEAEYSLRNVIFKYKEDDILDKNRAMDNVQKHYWGALDNLETRILIAKGQN
jgi:hypothetical protein